jgi:hypothetical protein
MWIATSFIVSNVHRLLVAGLPAHCETFRTLPDKGARLGGTTTASFAPYAFGINLPQIEAGALAAVNNNFLAYPTVGANANSPLPNGKQLNMNFEAGSDSPCQWRLGILLRRDRHQYHWATVVYLGKLSELRSHAISYRSHCSEPFRRRLYFD